MKAHAFLHGSVQGATISKWLLFGITWWGASWPRERTDSA